MKKTYAVLLAISMVLTAVGLSACADGENKDGRAVEAKSVQGIPVPATAEKVSGQALGKRSGGWSVAYADAMKMTEAAKWYEDKLKAAGFDYEKSPEKPLDEGYTIFNFKRDNQDLKVVVVDDSNRSGSTIQLSAESVK